MSTESNLMRTNFTKTVNCYEEIRKVNIRLWKCIHVTEMTVTEMIFETTNSCSLWCSIGIVHALWRIVATVPLALLSESHTFHSRHVKGDCILLQMWWLKSINASWLTRNCCKIAKYCHKRGFIYLLYTMETGSVFWIIW